MKLKLNKKNLRVLTDAESNSVAGGATIGTCETCNTGNGCTTQCTNVNCTNNCGATQDCTKPPNCGGTTIPNWCRDTGGPY